MKAYGIALLVLTTAWVLFALVFFKKSGKLAGGIRAALKAGLLLYPLAVGIIRLASENELAPHSFWRFYLIAATAWLLWIVCAPARFRTREALSNPELKGSPILCWLAF